MHLTTRGAALPLLTAAFAAAASPAGAHGPRSTGPHDAFASWRPDLLILAGIAVAAGLSLAGARRGNRRPPLMVLAGLAVVVIALASPLDEIAHVLLSAHMAQHVLLMLVAAPLLAAGKPFVAVSGIVTARARRALRSPSALTRFRARNPIAWWTSVAALHAVVVWSWHVPAAYEAATSNAVLHALEHATMLGVSLLLWGTLFGARRRPAHGAAPLFLLLASAPGAALAALMTFSTVSWYPLYEQAAAGWGITAADDQRAAGLIMWTTAGMVYGLAGIAFFVRWLVEAERRAPSAHERAA